MIYPSSSLVLEGGGMRGVFTAGVLDCFLDKDLNFEHLVGVSAGSCHACSYLSHQKGRGFHTVVDNLKDRRYCSLYSLVRTGDLFGVEMAYDEIPNKLYPFDYTAYEQNPTVFHAVITNCETGLAEYPLIEDLHKDIIYIRASSSLPAVSRLVDICGTPYLDGGIADSIPIRFSLSQGYQKPVVVLTQPKDYEKKPNRLMPWLKAEYRKYPRLVESLANRHLHYNDTLAFLDELEAAGKVFIIRPDAALAVDRIEKNRIKLATAYRQGYHTAAECMDDLKKYLTQN